MPRVHRVGDYDSGADRAVTGSPNVFVNGGPTLGGDLATVLGLEDTVGIDDETARRVIETRAALIQKGLNPDEYDLLETAPGQVTPSGRIHPPAPGSPAGSGGAAATSAPPVGGQAQGNDTSGSFSGPAPGPPCVLPNITWDPTADNRIKSDLCQKLAQLQQAAGVPLYINSGYRDPQHNRDAGGSKDSQHLRGTALDIRWPASDRAGRGRFVELAASLGFDGVGFYSSFIHIDTRGYKALWGSYSPYAQILRSNGWDV